MSSPFTVDYFGTAICPRYHHVKYLPLSISSCMHISVLCTPLIHWAPTIIACHPTHPHAFLTVIPWTTVLENDSESSGIAADFSMWIISGLFHRDRLISTTPLFMRHWNSRKRNREKGTKGERDVLINYLSLSTFICRREIINRTDSSV